MYQFSVYCLSSHPNLQTAAYECPLQKATPILGMSIFISHGLPGSRRCTILLKKPVHNRNFP
jgi:hypothetical protein